MGDTGVLKTVEEVIAVLKNCDPKAKVVVGDGRITVVEFSRRIYLDVVKQG